MFRIGAYGLVVTGIIHLLVLGVDAASYAPGWLSGSLWTMDHWFPIAQQSPQMVQSGLAFWSTLGSCAVPLIAFGLLLLWLDRRNQPVPRFLMYALLAWALALTALMPPSGYPLVVAATLALVFGRPTGGWA